MIDKIQDGFFLFPAIFQMKREKNAKISDTMVFCQFAWSNSKFKINLRKLNYTLLLKYRT